MTGKKKCVVFFLPRKLNKGKILSKQSRKQRIPISLGRSVLKQLRSPLANLGKNSSSIVKKYRKLQHYAQ